LTPDEAVAAILKDAPVSCGRQWFSILPATLTSIPTYRSIIQMSDAAAKTLNIYHETFSNLYQSHLKKMATTYYVTV